MAREAGATQVFMASAAPPVRFANVYGIDMPSRNELIGAFRSEDEIAHEIGADALLYQDLDDLMKDVMVLNPTIEVFETSCFDGFYVTGDITAAYLNEIEDARNTDVPASNSRDDEGDEDNDGGQMDLNLVSHEDR